MSTIDIDALVDLAQRVSAGEITRAEAEAVVDALARDDEDDQ